MTNVNGRRVGDLVNDIEEGRLILRPYFQRRLVWTNTVKDRFLETVRLGLPFPEIFMATGELDTKTMKRKNLLVDGQQRISTLKEYVRNSPDLVLKLVKPYLGLPETEKTKFLDYVVAVRDLGTVTPEQIKEIFSRINSTDFALKAMERRNALYSGDFKQFCDDLSRNNFFQKHRVFSLSDVKRMRDLDFCVILITTMLSTYYNRDEKNEEYLLRYNDSFPLKDEVVGRLNATFNFIERCNFGEKSRVWKKTDLFTFLVELDSALNVQKLLLDPAIVKDKLSSLYSHVNELYKAGEATGTERKSEVSADVFKYLKAATKATNDKYARVDRAIVISHLIKATALPKPTITRVPPKRRRKLT
jgi:uncharacterized protein DUF262